MPVTESAQHFGLLSAVLNGVSLYKKGTPLMGFITYTSVVGDPIVVEAEDRWIEIVTDLDRAEYNNEHGYHRQDRKGVKFCSWDAYNSYGNQEAGSTPSAEGIVCENETATEQEHLLQAVGELLVELIKKLPPAQREVFIAIRVEQRPAVEVAAARGVSKAAISKTLKKATEHLREGLIAAGVNSSDLHGLPVSEAHGTAQEGTNK